MQDLDFVPVAFGYGLRDPPLKLPHLAERLPPVDRLPAACQAHRRTSPSLRSFRLTLLSCGCQEDSSTTSRDESPKGIQPASRGEPCRRSEPAWSAGRSASAPIRPITGRPSLAPSSCTDPPSGRLAVTPTRLPAVLGPRDPLGPICAPDARVVCVWNRYTSHSRASCLLAQAYQVLWLVPFDDACDREHLLTIGSLPLALIAADLLNVASLTVRDVRALSAGYPPGGPAESPSEPHRGMWQNTW